MIVNVETVNVDFPAKYTVAAEPSGAEFTSKLDAVKELENVNPPDVVFEETISPYVPLSRADCAVEPAKMSFERVPANPPV